MGVVGPGVVGPGVWVSGFFFCPKNSHLFFNLFLVLKFDLFIEILSLIKISGKFFFWWWDLVYFLVEVLSESLLIMWVLIFDSFWLLEIIQINFIKI